MPEDTDSHRRFSRQALIAAVIAAVLIVLALLAWYLSQVLLVVFAALLFGITLEGFARPIQRYARLPRPAAVILVVTLLVALFSVAMVIGGPAVGDQVAQLGERIPSAMDRIREVMEDHVWGRLLLERLPPLERVVPAGADILGRISGVFSTALGAIANTAIIFVIGFYLALDPAPYVTGTVHLIPKAHRGRASEVIEALGHALRWWLVGRFSAMAAVGVLTALGLWLIGMPLVLALGLIAGVLSFVPYFGPIVSAIPAVLIALVGGPLQAVQVVLLYVIVQFLEGNLITPLIQVRAVSLPPAVLLSAQVLMGVLFGLLGVLLATPLVVALIVVVQMLYIRDVLGDRVAILGSRHQQV